MSGAAEARDALRAVLKRSYAPIYEAGRAYATAWTHATTTDDLLVAMDHTIDAIRALARMHEMAELAEKEIRGELATIMLTVGCHQISSGNATASLVRRRPFVVIDDQALIPDDFMHQPALIPDKAKIKAAIEAGESVAGAGMIIPNESYVSIRARGGK